jgi:isoleucyl-tRNA synthetase
MPIRCERSAAAEVARFRDETLERSVATTRQAVDLARTLRAQAGLRVRQPLARAWLAIPDRGLVIDDDLLASFAEDINVKDVEVIADGSALLDRRVKVLLPKVGKRLGSAVPAVMAAARDGAVEFHPDGSVTLADVTLTAHEVVIQATPRPGTAVADRDGLVVVLDTDLTPALRAEGDARELTRAVQDLRRDAGLELDDRIDLWLEGLDDAVAAHLATVLADTLAERAPGPIPVDGHRGTVALEAGPVTIALRRAG